MKKAILDIITFLGIQALVSLTVPLVWGMVTGSPDVTTALMITTTVIFSLLTTNNFEQALDRAGGKHGNKGVEGAVTALKMTALQKELERK